MSLSMNVDNILNSDKEVFEEILEKIETEKLSSAKNDLEGTDKFNMLLYDSIDFTLKRLHEEENFISEILYKSFGVGKKKNQRREQLIVLGSQLKTEIKRVEKNRKKIKFHYDSISDMLKNLTRLSKSFGRKVLFLTKPKQQKRCNEYLKELYLKIDETNICKKELDLKSIYLESSMFKYEEILKKIPRHHELKEERYLEHKTQK